MGMKALVPASLLVTYLVMFVTSISAQNEQLQALDSPVEGRANADAGFVWPGAVRTVSVEGDESACKHICNVYLNSTTGNSIFTIQPRMAFTSLQPGKYTVSAICRGTAKLHCIIESGSVEFEVGDGSLETALDDIDLGTIHAKVEETGEMDSPGRSVLPAFFAVVVVEAVGLFLISEALKMKIAQSL